MSADIAVAGPQTITVHGNASAEELAAVLAVVAQQEIAPQPPPPYERWRSTRLAALRRSSADGCATIVR